MEASHCDFCNSTTHPTRCCNSNFGGKRKGIDNRWFMLEDVCPVFGEFNHNELKYIACKKALYEKGNNVSDRMGRDYNRKYIRNPIPITLSKRHLVIALEKRWNGLAPIRLLRNTPPENDTCPICIDVNITTSRFSEATSEWKTTISSETSELCITVCNHTFCNPCWKAHVARNCKMGEYVAGVWDETPFIACPMCRTKMTISRVPRQITA